MSDSQTTQRVLEFFTKWSQVGAQHQQNKYTPEGKERAVSEDFTSYEVTDLQTEFAINSMVLIPLLQSTDHLVDGEWLVAAQLRNAAKESQQLFDSYQKQLFFKFKNLLRVDRSSIDSEKALNELLSLYSSMQEHSPEEKEKAAKAMEEDLRKRNVPEALSMRARRMIPELLQALMSAMTQKGAISLNTPFEAFLKELQG